MCVFHRLVLGCFLATVIHLSTAFRSPQQLSRTLSVLPTLFAIRKRPERPAEWEIKKGKKENEISKKKPMNQMLDTGKVLENIVSGLVIERLGGCLLVEVEQDSKESVGPGTRPDRYHAVCYQRSALCDAQIVVGDYVDLSITSSPLVPIAVNIDDDAGNIATHTDNVVDSSDGSDTRKGLNIVSIAASAAAEADHPASATNQPAAMEKDRDKGLDKDTAAAAVRTVQGVVIRHHERRNVLQRPSPIGSGASSGGTLYRSKAIAANVDQIVVVVATTPVVPISSVDRILVTAHALGMEAIIVVNKVDLDGSLALVASLQHYPNMLDYPLIPVSVVTGEGVETLKEALRDALRGKNSVFVGQSGMGKSSLVNQLLPEGAMYFAKVGDLVKSINLGAHTTSSARLFHLPNGGSIVDSPGIREFGLWSLSNDDIEQGFVEIAELTTKCKFRNCKHTVETLGCAVQQGLVDGKVHPSRLESYFTFLSS